MTVATEEPKVNGVIWYDDPALLAKAKETGDAFRVWMKAGTRVRQCRKSEAVEAARMAEREAEKKYRMLSDERDQLRELTRARYIQRSERAES